MEESMYKKLQNGVLATLGIASVTFSFVLLFSGTAMAYCTVTENCSGGGVISCSGDTCNSDGVSVTCTSKARPQEPIRHSCP